MPIGDVQEKKKTEAVFKQPAHIKHKTERIALLKIQKRFD
jgi:hypothetical protein